MSLLTLPIIFINMGGEMLYILDQRLAAQNIPENKSLRVMRDIIEQMFNKDCIKEIFKPQAMFHKKDIRAVFDRLAHTSIMKLNPSSMDKLYDLMTMAFKYQIMHCRHPRDILLITLNHLDAMNTYSTGSSEHESYVQLTYSELMSTYGNLTTTQLHELCNTLLMFLQDMHIRVSIFLRDHVQLPTGKFIIPLEGELYPETEIPGIVKRFKNGEEIQRNTFLVPGKYIITKNMGSLELQGNRAITLGSNMYKTTSHASKTDTPLTRAINVNSPSVETSHDVNLETVRKANTTCQASNVTQSNTASLELNALARLIGINHCEQEDKSEVFNLALFDDTDTDIIPGGSGPKPTVPYTIHLEPTKKEHSTINRIVEEFSAINTNPGNENADDILELMDAAAKMSD